MKANAQVLIFVIIMLVLLGIFGGALAYMWEKEAELSSINERSFCAYYLAQAGVERTKIARMYDVNEQAYCQGSWCPGLTGGIPWPAGGGPNRWWNDLACGSGNFLLLYHAFSPPSSGQLQKDISAEGTVVDANNNVVAYRKIYVEIDNISDSEVPTPPDPYDTPDGDNKDNYFKNNDQLPNTWEEQ